MPVELSVEERVRNIIVEELCVKREEVAPEVHLTRDLGADSLDLISIIIALKDEFEIDIPDKDEERICAGTVSGLVEYIKGKTGV